MPLVKITRFRAWIESVCNVGAVAILLKNLKMNMCTYMWKGDCQNYFFIFIFAYSPHSHTIKTSESKHHLLTDILSVRVGMLSEN